MDRCRICFTTNSNLEILGDTQEKQFLEGLFTRDGINEQLDDCYLICYECKALLKKCYNFIDKILKAQRAFLILQRHQADHSDSWGNLIKNELGLHSTLSYHKAEITLFLKEDDDLLQEDEIEFNKLPDVLIKVEEPNTTDLLDNNEDEIQDEGEILEPCHLSKSIEEETFKPTRKSETETITTHFCHENNDQNTKDDDVVIVDDSEYSKPNIISISSSEDESKPKKKKAKKKVYFDDDKKVEYTRRKCTKPRKKQKKVFYYYTTDEGENNVITNGEENVNCTELYPDVILTEKRKKTKAKKYVESEDEEQIKPNEEINSSKRKWKKDKDEDFTIKSEVSDTESEESYDSYDDKGKKLKKPPREYPRKCDHCDTEIDTMKFHYRHYLIYHSHDMYPYRRNRQKEFVCQHCGARKRNNGELVEHEKIHTGKKDVLCPHCGKAFFSKKDLINHRNRVHGERKFLCDHCNRRFQSRADLVRHIRTHTGEKPFKCTICEVSYATLGNLTSHLKKGHNRLDDESAIVSRRRKKKISKKSKYQDTDTDEISDDDNFVPTKRKKTSKKAKKAKTQAKHNEDTTSSNSKVQETNDFENNIPTKIIKKKNVKKSKKSKAQANNSKLLETDDEDDEIPLKVIKKKALKKAEIQTEINVNKNTSQINQPEENSIQAKSNRNCSKDSTEVQEECDILSFLEHAEI